jgi:hypothetical protein
LTGSVFELVGAGSSVGNLLPIFTNGNGDINFNLTITSPGNVPFAAFSIQANATTTNSSQLNEATVGVTPGGGGNYISAGQSVVGGVVVSDSPSATTFAPVTTKVLNFDLGVVNGTINNTTFSVPEPGTVALLMTGLLALFGLRRQFS